MAVRFTTVHAEKEKSWGAQTKSFGNAQSGRDCTVTDGSFVAMPAKAGGGPV